MASQIFAKEGMTVLARHKTRVVAYLPSLKSAVRHFRAFSSYDEQRPEQEYIEVKRQDTSLRGPWPDDKLGILNPVDKNCPLPGNVGIPLELRTKLLSDTPVEITSVTKILSSPTPQERQVSILQQFNMATAEMDEQESGFEPRPSPFDCLECVVQACPQIMKKDFQDLFPDRILGNSDLTVLTISQKTENDMTGWSESVEEEREILLEHFIAGAQEICSTLQQVGYWADFIDPSSGRPYLGAFTNASMFETDERYRKLGFDIEDLGCCKVITHHIWGTHSYVGCLFTDAPSDHPLLQSFLNYDSEMDE